MSRYRYPVCVMMMTSLTLIDCCWSSILDDSWIILEFGIRNSVEFHRNSNFSGIPIWAYARQGCYRVVRKTQGNSPTPALIPNFQNLEDFEFMNSWIRGEFRIWIFSDVGCYIELESWILIDSWRVFSLESWLLTHQSGIGIRNSNFLGNSEFQFGLLREARLLPCFFKNPG